MLARVEMPVATMSALLFHVYQVIVFVCWGLWCLHTLRPRRGAPSIREGAAHELAQFRAKHGRLLGAILTQFGTNLPSSTYSYYLVEANFFSFSVSQAHRALWRGVVAIMIANAIGQFAHFAVTCIESSGALAEQYVVICAAPAGFPLRRRSAAALLETSKALPPCRGSSPSPRQLSARAAQPRAPRRTRV